MYRTYLLPLTAAIEVENAGNLDAVLPWWRRRW